MNALSAGIALVVAAWAYVYVLWLLVGKSRPRPPIERKNR